MKTFQLETFLDFTYLSGLNFSETGDFLAYTTHKANLKTNGYDTDLFVSPLENQKAPVQLTTSGKVGKYFWHENGLVYSSMKDPEIENRVKAGEPLTAFYKISPSGGESVPYMEMPLKVLDIKPIQGDLFLVLAQYLESYEHYNQASKEEKLKLIEAWKDENLATVVEEIPFWSNGGTFTKGARNRLYLYDKSTAEYRALTSETMMVQHFDYCEASGQLIYVGKDYTDKMPLTSEVYLGNLSSETFKPLTGGEYAIHTAYIMPEGQLIFWGHDRLSYGLNQNGIFYKFDISQNKMSVLYDNLMLTVGNTVGSDCRFGGKRTLKKDKNSLYFISTEGFNAYLNKLDMAGQCTRLTALEGSVDDFDVYEEMLVINAMRGNSPNELYCLSHSSEEKLSHHNDWMLEYACSTPEHICIETEPGVFIDGWVMKPIGFEKGKKYPSILNIHGGPKTVYGSVLYFEMQYFASQGYFVFFCNPRGSDGKGNAFADIRGKYGSIDYDDIMAFTDKVISENAEIDSNRMYVTGGSYGGFMTNWIVGHTHRFRAAASQRSISNWVTEYGVTDIGYYFVPDQIAATPWSDYEKLWAMSPLKYANEVKTPTLFIHSDEDYRCWVPEAMQMFTALKDHGVPSKMVIFKGENHELSRSGKPKNRKRRIDEILKWFESHQ